jgi:hypothetical protein
MSSSALSFLLLMTLPLLGGNDLLDMVETEDYWKSRHVEMSVDAMLSEFDSKPAGDLSDLIKQLGADEFRVREAATKAIRAAGPGAIEQLRKAAGGAEPEVAERAAALIKQIGTGAVATAERRLMAIRTLGELKNPDAVPHLKKLLDNKEPFVAEYAEAAIAAIERKKYERPRPTLAQRDEDLHLLPKESMFVVQAGMQERIPISWKEILKRLDRTPPKAGGDATRKEFEAAFRTLLERGGNVRVDLVTIGLAGNMFTEDGFAVVVFRGQYHAEGFKQEAINLGMIHARVDGFDVIEHPSNRSAAVILASNERMVIVGSPRGELSLAKMTGVLKRGKGSFAENEEFAKLVKTVDRSKPVWAASIPGEMHRGVTGIEHLESMTLEVSHDDAALSAVCKVRARDFAEMKESLDSAMGLRDYVAQVSPGLIAQEPQCKSALDFIASIKLSDDGKEFTLTGRVAEAAELLMLPVILGRGEVK